jgi:hypothetical protein
MKPTMPVVLLVEDNPDLRNLLHCMLTPEGFVCEDAENEHEAVAKVSASTLAVVADINLSETGGDQRGGINLAETLAQDHLIPVILISQTPWHYFSGLGTDSRRVWMRTHNVRAVLDRGDEDFAAQLCGELNDVRQQSSCHD